MSLHYIIDGYNLIRHRLYCPGNKSRDERLGLLVFLRAEKPCGSLKNRITVVFDGYPGALEISEPRIEVIFSGEQSADDKIIKMLRGKAAARNTVVISDDRQIRDAVRLEGLTSLGIEEFLRPKKKNVSGRKAEMFKPELDALSVSRINRELEKLWLEK
jgi:predicted RNA-binding protein with PIN domain